MAVVGASRTTDSSSESVSEHSPLLASDAIQTAVNKSVPDTDAEENGPLEDESYNEGVSRPQSVVAVLSVLMIGVFVSNADSTLVMATYTSISSEFGSLGNAAWLSTSYTLAMCAVQGIVGKLSDIYGRKGVLLVSYAIFAAGSVFTGFAQSMWQAIVGRIVSGLGAAAMVVIVSVLITDLVPLIQVASWRSYVNVFATLGRSIGGPLGGFLADTVGWRWSFIGQGPLILFALFLISLKLPSNTQTKSSQPKGQPSKLRRVDFIGALLLALTIVTSLGALSLGGQELNWSHPLILSLSAASVLLGSLFVFWEGRFALEPIFPPALVIQRDVATSYVIYAFQTAAQVSMMFSVPLYFRVTTNASNTVAGAHLLPAVLGNTVGGLIAGHLIRRTARYKTLTILATICSCITYILLILRWHGEISMWESLEIMPGGFGSGLAGSSTFIALTASVAQKDMATSAGGLYLASAFGMLAGIAVSSSVQLSSLRSLLLERVRGPGSDEIISSVISDISTIPSFAAPLQKIIIDSYVISLEYSHMVSLSCSLLAVLFSFTIREHPLR